MVKIRVEIKYRMGNDRSIKSKELILWNDQQNRQIFS